PGSVFVFSSAQIVSETAVVISGQTVKPFGRVRQNSLRYPEIFPRIQRITEHNFRKPHHHSGLIVLILFHRTFKISAVNKGHSIAASEPFAGVFLRQNHGRIILMAGSAPAASDYLPAVAD